MPTPADLADDIRATLALLARMDEAETAAQRLRELVRLAIDATRHARLSHAAAERQIASLKDELRRYVAARVDPCL